MGYRTRLGKIAKIEKEKYKGKSCEEVIAMIGILSPYYPPEHFEMYEIGKYIDYTDIDLGLKPFYDFDVYKECEAEFSIIEKQGLLFIINDYHIKIYENYKSIADGKEEVMPFIKSRVIEWEKRFGVLPYWLDKKHTDGPIVRSWQYEYAIFNLVHIYRFFDWENDHLIYSAW